MESNFQRRLCSGLIPPPVGFIVINLLDSLLGNRYHGVDFCFGLRWGSNQSMRNRFQRGAAGCRGGELNVLGSYVIAKEAVGE